jgi:hypothetical protein
VADYCCLAKASRRAIWEVIKKKSRTAFLLLAPPPPNKPVRGKKAPLGPHLKCRLDTLVLKTQIDMHVIIGTDVAFAMVVGTEARAVYQWRIGQIAKLLKVKEFRDSSDRTKCPFINFIGVVRINIDDTRSSSSTSNVNSSSSIKGTYSNTEAARSSLDGALKLATSANHGTGTAVGEKKKKGNKKKLMKQPKTRSECRSHD